MKLIVQPCPNSWLYLESFLFFSSSQVYFLIAPGVDGVPGPVTFPEGGISISAEFQADWNPEPQAAVFKVYKCLHSCDATIINPAGIQAR